MTLPFLCILGMIVGLSGIIFFTEYLHSHYFLERNYTRKIAHVLGCLSSMIFLIKGFSPRIVFSVAFFFFLLLLTGKIKGYFSSIDSVQSGNFGSILLPVSVFILYLINNYCHEPVYFILPLLILAISDPLAWIAGTHFKGRTKRIILFGRLIKKTFPGSLAFFLSTFTITLITLLVFDYSPGDGILLGMLIAVTGTMVELVSPFGTDNLFVPLITATMLLVFN